MVVFGDKLKKWNRGGLQIWVYTSPGISQVQSGGVRANQLKWLLDQQGFLLTVHRGAACDGLLLLLKRVFSVEEIKLRDSGNRRTDFVFVIKRVKSHVRFRVLTMTEAAAAALCFQGNKDGVLYRPHLLQRHSPNCVCSGSDLWKRWSTVLPFVDLLFSVCQTIFLVWLHMSQRKHIISHPSLVTDVG